MSQPKRGRVVHCKVEPYDIYIGRPSEWGNPFACKPGTLACYQLRPGEDAVAAYEAWLRKQPHLLAKLPALRGKVLGCWCKTKRNPDAPCHGDVLLKLIDELEAKEQT